MVRTALAAAVIGALCCAGAGAVRLGLVQAEVFFFSTEEDLAAAAAKDGRLTGVAYYGGADYEQLQSTAEWAALQWEGIPGETLTEERTGGVGDGWTAMRTYHGEEEGEEAASRGVEEAELNRRSKATDARRVKDREGTQLRGEREIKGPLSPSQAGNQANPAPRGLARPSPAPQPGSPGASPSPAQAQQTTGKRRLPQ